MLFQPEISANFPNMIELHLRFLETAKLYDFQRLNWIREDQIAW